MRPLTPEMFSVSFLVWLLDQSFSFLSFDNLLVALKKVIASSSFVTFSLITSRLGLQLSSLSFIDFNNSSYFFLSVVCSDIFSASFSTLAF